MAVCPSPRTPEERLHEESVEDGFGVYIHWPFCVSKCPYCDFNSHVAREPVDDDLWTKMLTAELDATLDELPGAPVSVFFGGGTPSLMAPKSVATLLEVIAKRCGLGSEVEVSLEANPESVTPEKLQGFRAAGVTRLSLGVQALEDAALQSLGRPHDVAMALSAVQAARNCFERISFDLIYARPEQSVADWRAELSRALEEDAGHISLYQLTIEPNTPYARWHESGHLHLPPEEIALEQLEVAAELCTQAGLPAYEVSNHARMGEECRHNLVYWRYGFYAGIGPGAHGRLPGARRGERIATETHRDPARWLEQVHQQGHGLARKESLSLSQQADEMMLMGLRLREGVNLERYAQLMPEGISQGRLEELVDEGLLWRSSERIGCTMRGTAVLDGVLARLLG